MNSNALFEVVHELFITNLGQGRYKMPLNREFMRCDPHKCEDRSIDVESVTSHFHRSRSSTRWSSHEAKSAKCQALNRRSSSSKSNMGRAELCLGQNILGPYNSSSFLWMILRGTHLKERFELVEFALLEAFYLAGDKKKLCIISAGNKIESSHSFYGK